MSTINDGGPAFPRSDAGYSPTQDGMSLRDWFAGQTLAGLISSAEEHYPGPRGDPGALKEWSDSVDARWAKYCYKMADAMIAAREAKP